MIINPQDRTARSNIAEHDQMIEAINANDVLVNEAKSDSATALETASEAKTEVVTARQTADDAKTLATTANSKASTNATDIAKNTVDIGTLNGLMAYMNTNAFVTVVFNKTATAITAVFSRKDGSKYSANLPLATTTTAGLMDSAMKQQLDANTNAILVLQSQYPTIFVTFPNASPTQAEIQTVYDNYRTAYPAINLPAIPAQGFTMIDTGNNVSVEYDRIMEQWVFSTNAISKATNSTYGVLVGEENGADGSLYIVAGKALVIGFDALKSRMDDAETAIALKVSTDTYNAFMTTYNNHVASTSLHKTADDNTKLGTIPLIGSGDAGKILTVKSDLTGYENADAGAHPTFHGSVVTFSDVITLMNNCKLGDKIMGTICNSNGNYLCFNVTKMDNINFLGAIIEMHNSSLKGSFEMHVQDSDLKVKDYYGEISTYLGIWSYPYVSAMGVTNVFDS